VETEAGINPKDILGLEKAPLRLIPGPSLVRLSKAMELGAKKYGPYNWRAKAVRYSVYLEAAMRHILSALDGEDLDRESGQPHAAHAMACMAIVLDAQATGNLIDDRPTPGVTAQLIAETTKHKLGDPPTERPATLDVGNGPQPMHASTETADRELVRHAYNARSGAVAALVAGTVPV
jgi:hypothetical protein